MKSQCMAVVGSEASLRIKVASCMFYSKTEIAILCTSKLLAMQ